MKKFASLFVCMAAAMFAIGCAEAEKAAGDAKAKAETTVDDAKTATGDAMDGMTEKMQEKAGEVIDDGAAKLEEKAPEEAGGAIDAGAGKAKEAVGAGN